MQMRKRKSCLSGLVMVALVLTFAAPAMAIDWLALGVPEMAQHRGATHVAVIDYADLASYTTSNTAAVITNAILAKTGVEFVELMLDTAFDTGNTNYTGSVAVKVGDGSDDDLFLTSTELASDGSEVFIKYGAPNSATITSTPTKQTADFLSGVTLQTISLTDTNGVTALAVTGLVQTTSAVLTNVTVASTASIGELGYKVYSSAGSLVFTLTPNSEEALSANTSGSVRLYFRLTKFR